MKTQRKLLLVALAPVMAMVGMWEVNSIVPYGPKFCSLHERACVTERVKASPYRVSVLRHAGYYEAVSKLFPNSNHNLVYCPIPLTWQTRRYCPICREAEQKWGLEAVIRRQEAAEQGVDGKPPEAPQPPR